MYLVKTNHFEILFPKESAETAKYIADNADSLYEKAKSAVNLKHDFSMPVIISPDSDYFKVVYTTNPYNRIVIFDSAVQDSSKLEVLYHEIFKALSASVRSPLNHFIYKTVGGDGFQPVSLINLPFSFSEGYANIEAPLNKDAYYQQLLIQAKFEGHFPSWFQAAAVRDIHPGIDLNLAAGSAFSAYLMQAYGVEKYQEFWNECGKLHLYFVNGIFYKVYGKPLFTLWKEFKDSIPSPEDVLKMKELEALSSEVVENDSQGLFEHILYSNYGIVWYDGIRHEVDVFDPLSKFQIRQLLFIAEDITRLSLSPDRRYMAVSFMRSKGREEFKEVVTHIFDLKEREFLDYKFSLKEAGFVLSEEGELCLAGISVSQKKPVIQIYTLPKKDDDSIMIFEKSFESDEVPFELNPAGNGRLSYLLKKEAAVRLVIESFENELLCWTLKDSDENEISPLSLSFISGEKPVYSFSYIPQGGRALARSGYITLDEELMPEEVFLQNCNVSGGMYYPVPADSKIFYCAKKTFHNELRSLAQEEVSFSAGIISEEGRSEDEENQDSEKNLLPVDSRIFFNPKAESFGKYSLNNYNPLKYMLHASVMPFLAIRNISLENGAVLWPSLGLTLHSDSDPMRNTEYYISAGIDFLIFQLERYINATPEQVRAELQTVLDESKRYSAAAFVKNYSTPVDIEAGAIFNVNKHGEYDFNFLAKTAWGIPVGNILRNMNFYISSNYNSSTDYYDSNKSEIYPSMAGWTPFWDAYETFELAAGARFSNSHQYGISKYERRGLTLGGRFSAMWDINEMDLLNSFRSEKQALIDSGDTSELTQAQLDAIYNERALDISQMNLGLFATVEIPRLNPLEIHDGWVLSLPSSIHAELLYQTGTALEVCAEVLLLGNEIQNGFPFLYLFFSRAGLKAGYDFCLNYDTTQVLLPDIRRENYFYDTFSASYVQDSFYLLLNTDFIVPVGKLSQVQFMLNAKAEFFPRSHGFKFSMTVNADF